MEVPLSSTVKMNIWYLQLITCHQSVRLILLFKHMNKKTGYIIFNKLYTNKITHDKLSLRIKRNLKKLLFLNDTIGSKPNV